MKKIYNLVSALFILLAINSQAATIPVDLTGWQNEGDGIWNVQPGNDSVIQTRNGNPTVFFNNGVNAQGQALSGEITVNTTSDDDFIGFVLGYQSGALFNSPNTFYLIDWKQNDQSPGIDGLALSSVSNVSSAGGFPDYWSHTGGVTELQRATNLGSTGWNDNQTYTFDLVFTPNLIQVYVDNVLEINFSGTFSDGSFGFYNYSQGNVQYAGLTTQQADNFVPEPSSIAILSLGLLGLLARRRA